MENGKILDICDNAVSKYNVGHVSIDACGHYVTPGFVEPHCQLGVREQVFRFEGDDSDESTDPILPQLRALDAINPADEGFQMALARRSHHGSHLPRRCKSHRRNMCRYQDLR